MRILLFTENFPPETNAAATRIHERAVYWVKWGHEVTIVTGAPNFPLGRVFDGYRNLWYQRETIDGINVVRVKTFITRNEGVKLRSLDFASFMVTGFLAGLVQRRPDVVIANSPQFLTAVAAWALCFLRRLPFVFELADLWPRSIVAVGARLPPAAIRGLEWLELFLYRRAASVVALTRTFKHDLVTRGIPADKIAVILNGVDLPRYAPRPRDLDLANSLGLSDKFVLGYIGTHGMAHDLARVLDAAERLRHRPRIAFLLAGAGAERDGLIDDARRRGLDNVVFLPLQPKDRMPAVWSLCDVALIHLRNDPAFAEVIPSKMFEAMGMGLPLLLGVPQGEASAIVEADGAGLWVPSGDVGALADAAARLCDDDDLRRRLAAASLAAAPRHDRQTQARLFIEALELVNAGHGDRTGTIMTA